MTEDFPLPSDVRKAFGLAEAVLHPLKGDASSRRYARVLHPDHGPCLVLQDAPFTPHFVNFIAIGRHLHDLGFCPPKIHAVAEDRGFALIEDFGDHTYTEHLKKGADEKALYALAARTLADLHGAAGATAIELPGYDSDRLLDEVSLFTDWFAPSTGVALPDDIKSEHRSLWQDALAPVAECRDALVLRDYHVDNLLLLEGSPNGPRCGLLDFQDGLIGSPAYDLVSLTQDARRDVSDAIERHCLRCYLDQRPEIDEEAFLRDFHLLGAQRHAKVAGIFHRLNSRDGKPGYLVHVPRVLGLLERALNSAGLDSIRDFYDETIPMWRSGARGSGR